MASSEKQGKKWQHGQRETETQKRAGERGREKAREEGGRESKRVSVIEKRNKVGKCDMEVGEATNISLPILVFVFADVGNL